MQAQTEEETERVSSRAAHNLCFCVRVAKTGQSDVRRLPVLSEIKTFGVAIQDSRSSKERWVG